MKTKELMKVCLLCAMTLTTACNNETEVFNFSTVNSRSVSAIVLEKNPVYTLGRKDNNIYTATPLKPVSASTWDATTEMDITIKAPNAITLTGISARVNGEVVTFAEFQNSDTENHVSLAKGEGIRFCFPMLPASGELTIRLHTTGSQIIEQSVSGEVTAGTVCTLVLDSFIVASGNNWMGALDDDMYVAQVSLPGTHDAATGDGTTFSIGKTQSLSLQEQWNMGIRVFDLRPGYKKVRQGWFKYVNQLHIYHGIVATNTSWDEAIDCLTANLATNPEEFAIVIMRFENDSPMYNNRSTWNSLMSSYLNSELPSAYKVDFRPDLKVKDVRGKLLIHSRDSYADAPITGGYISGWSHSETGSTSGSIWGKNSTTTTLNIQDYYSVTNSDQKWSSICDFMDWAGNASVQTWTINHTSGYSGSTGSNKTYCQNAANNNPAAYRYIIDNDRTDGNVGIIMMDHVGSRTIKSGLTKYTVYGDLLPQAIIDNNFRW